MCEGCEPVCSCCGDVGHRETECPATIQGGGRRDRSGRREDVSREDLDELWQDTGGGG